MTLPAAFPTSLDALANPTPTTNRDDPGFELDLVIARIHDILEAIESKVGIGVSAPGAGPSVLRRTASGTSMWQQVAPGDITGTGSGDANTVVRTTSGLSAVLGKVITADIDVNNQIGHRRLAYTLAADITVGSSVAAADLIADQPFTSSGVDSVFQVAVRLAGSVVFGGEGVIGFLAKVDAATNYLLSSAAGAASGAYDGFSGGSFFLTGLGAGTHNVRVLYAGTTNGHAINVRANSQPNTEGLSIGVTEWKR